MIDEWGGLADLLANLIEKYASVLDIENMSDEAQKIELTDREKEKKWNLNRFRYCKYY